MQKRDFFGQKYGEPTVFDVKTGNSKLTEAQEQRKRQLKLDLFKVAYWQRRAKVAEDCHRRRRLREIAEAGIDLDRVVHCPAWPAEG